MIFEKISENSTFLYSKEIELLFCTLQLYIETKHANVQFERICSSERKGQLRSKYYFLSEIENSLSEYHKQAVLEHLMDIPLKDFTLDTFEHYLLSLSKEQFLTRFFDLKEGIAQGSIDSEEQMEAFFQAHHSYMNSFIVMASLFRNTKRYIQEFFALAREFDTNEFNQVFLESKTIADKELERSRQELMGAESLEFSQKLMGKTFHNRGPYERFYFSPSIMAPFKAIRFFGKDQILFYNVLTMPLEDDALSNQLKVIADSTRLKIITLLNEKEPLRGLDIAKELNLAPSTVSHHMEQLKSAGLLNEEQVRSSKYFSIGRNSMNELLAALTKKLAKNE